MLKFLPVILCIVLSGLFSVPAEAQKRESGNLVLDGLPELPADLIEQLDRYQNTRSASLADWDPRGGLYIGTRFGEVVQIHHVAAPGAMREQVTFFREPVTGAQVCPDPARNGFSYVRDAGGNENFQIYYYDRNDGSSKLLSDGKSRHSGALWSRKGDRFAYSSNRRNGRDGDIYIASLAEPGQAKMVYEANGSWSAQDWSTDESKLIIGRNVSVRESYLYLLDIASGKTEQINPVKKQIAYGRARFTPDGKGIYLISDEDS
ncbi:MAG: S9 family peptidase, partial [Bacteroidetes bacterium]